MTEGNRIWNDEVEACVVRSFSRHPFTAGDSRTRAISRHVKAVMTELGEKADLNMVAAAVAAHVPH